MTPIQRKILKFVAKRKGRMTFHTGNNHLELYDSNDGSAVLFGRVSTYDGLWNYGWFKVPKGKPEITSIYPPSGLPLVLSDAGWAASGSQLAARSS